MFIATNTGVARTQRRSRNFVINDPRESRDFFKLSAVYFYNFHLWVLNMNRMASFLSS